MIPYKFLKIKVKLIATIKLKVRGKSSNIFNKGLFRNDMLENTVRYKKQNLGLNEKSKITAKQKQKTENRVCIC